MRTFERIIFALMLGAAPFAAPAFAFDGAPANQDTAIPVVSALPGAVGALKKAIPPSSIPDTSLTSLQYAAEGGHPIAQWKLGRMYADGNGVTQDDLRAFEYFSRIANAHAEDSPSAYIRPNCHCAIGWPPSAAYCSEVSEVSGTEDGGIAFFSAVTAPDWGETTGIAVS
jgi:hypothetical protein